MGNGLNFTVLIEGYIWVCSWGAFMLFRGQRRDIETQSVPLTVKEE